MNYLQTSMAYMLCLGIVIGIMGTLTVQIAKESMIDNEIPIAQYATANGLKGGLNGIYFPQGSFCVHLNRKNEAIFETMQHEWLHHLLVQDKMCGNESCRDHFCKKYYNETEGN